MNVDHHSHRTQLVAAALAASLATAGVISAYTEYSKSRRRRELDEDVRRSLASQAPLPQLSASTSFVREDANGAIRPKGRDLEPERTQTATPVEGVGAVPYVYDEELIREQLARNYAFFGEEGMRAIRGARVVVVGCGGVGSWAAVMLARSGVGYIRLVDFDYVTLSSLNRHATAGLVDVGTPKVQSIARAVRGFARWVEVDPRIDIWRKEEGGALLEGMDWVVDAIDNITTKVNLLAYCHTHSLRVFSAMGAGAKSDPSRIQIADIANTVYDPLARAVRRRLRLQGVASGIPVVYSTEVPGDVRLLPLPEEEFEKGPVKELGVFDDFRVRILPVLGPLPAIFGLNIATYILCALAGKPIEHPLPIKNRRKLYERLLRDLQVRESKIDGDGETVHKLPLDEDDVSFLLEDLHRGRSVLPPHLVPTRPTLVRWDPAAPVTPENVVVMEHADAERHMRECFAVSGAILAGRRGKFVVAPETVAAMPAAGECETPSERRRPEDLWGEEVGDIVRKRAAEVRRWREAVL